MLAAPKNRPEGGSFDSQHLNAVVFVDPLRVLLAAINPHARVGHDIGKLQKPRRRGVDLGDVRSSFEAAIVCASLCQQALALRVGVVVVEVEDQLNVSDTAPLDLVKLTKLPNCRLNRLDDITSEDGCPSPCCRSRPCTKNWPSGVF